MKSDNQTIKELNEVCSEMRRQRAEMVADYENKLKTQRLALRIVTDELALWNGWRAQTSSDYVNSQGFIATSSIIADARKVLKEVK